MQIKIVSVGIDTLKVNPKFIGDDGKPIVLFILSYGTARDVF